MKHKFSITRALKKIGIAIVSSLITLLVCEVAARVFYRPTDRGGDFLQHSNSPAIFDSGLGHIPRPGIGELEDGKWVTVNSDGTRKMRDGLTDGPAILAVGDSFTFGLELSDEESWPAQLERMTGKRVINAGVSGYGIDQIVLRAEKMLADSPDIDTVILCIFGEDINRCEFSYLWAQKPYFVLNGVGLELRAVPVGKGAPIKKRLRMILAHSRLADIVMRRLSPNWWLVESTAIRVHRDGLEVSKRLLARLHKETQRRGARLVFVPLVAWPNDIERLRSLARFAEKSKIETLDLNSELATMVHDDRSRWLAKLGHLNASGNRWVAERLRERMVTR